MNQKQTFESILNWDGLFDLLAYFTLKNFFFRIEIPLWEEEVAWRDTEQRRPCEYTGIDWRDAPKQPKDQIADNHTTISS